MIMKLSIGLILHRETDLGQTKVEIQMLLPHGVMVKKYSEICYHYVTLTSKLK